MKVTRVTGGLLLASGTALGVGIGAAGRQVVERAHAQSTPQVAVAQRGALTSEEQTIIGVARRATPTVVSITTARGSGGSGVIIRSDGMILTNAHVVGAGRTVRVGLADGRILEGRVLGRDQGLDVAVVRVEAASLPAASLGNSDELEPGQLAIAIGNPIGLERSVTTGVVSAVNRSPRGLGGQTFIQTDAAISPGNSGGPLLDSRGNVIGINSVVLRAPGSEGLGFAIPINAAMDMAGQVLETGQYRRAFVGISYGELTPEAVAQFRLPVRAGVIIGQVVPRSPAERAGLQPGDIITRANDTPVGTAGDLQRVIRAMRPGQQLRLLVQREPDWRQRTLTVRLGETSE